MSEIGCIACALDGTLGVPGQVHHLLSGGRRISHRHSVLLCPYHHTGDMPEGRKYEEFSEVHGPSLARNPRAFRLRYGDEEELLAIQDALLDHYQEVTQK